jgi:hypothetical protein
VWRRCGGRGGGGGWTEELQAVDVSDGRGTGAEIYGPHGRSLGSKGFSCGNTTSQVKRKAAEHNGLKSWAVISTQPCYPLSI